MKRIITILALVFTVTPMTRAGINIPGDGSDGQLIVTTNITIDLSQAVTGVWSNNNTANAGKGIYDSNKWAVVFKYTNVVIGTNGIVTFKNHPSRAPVVWLVNGNVSIQGLLSLNGSNFVTSPSIAEPGPGGFRGGLGDRSGALGGSGFGPGGGGDGAYATTGEEAPNYTYGNASLLPLIGGSGGRGWAAAGGCYSGSAGGGAILIACRETISISGTVRSKGGIRYFCGGGSGGGLRLIAETLTGNGNVDATSGSSGGSGWIRIERVVNSGFQVVTPTPSLVALDPGSTPVIWLPDGAPSVRVVSIGGINAPGDPRAEFGSSSAVDIQLIETNRITVVVETTNVEQASQVNVRLAPLIGSAAIRTNATIQQIISTNPSVIRWSVSVPTGPGFSTVQARVIRP